jgi:hypothetical protein
MRYYKLDRPKSEPSGHWTEAQVREISARLLGKPLDETGCAECPGAALHTVRTSRRDFRVFFTGRVPAAYCFHGHCAAQVEAFNKALWRELFGHGTHAQTNVDGPAPEASVRRNWREFDPRALEEHQQPAVKIGKEWLWKRSPVDCRSMAAGTFLTHISEPGDRLLVFTNERSQGQYLFWNHKEENRRGWYRLADYRDKHARFAAPTAETPADLMRARFGVWWLCQPVTGEWKTDGDHWSRRSEGNVTAWRSMVIESDEEGIEPAWLNLLAQVPLRIVALYTSGSRSVHALVRVDMPSKEAWDMHRDLLKPVLTRLGADKGVFTAVRLTRLPGCFRLGKLDRKTSRYVKFSEPHLQRLLYLNPSAEARPLIALPVLRDVPMWEQAYA